MIERRPRIAVLRDWDEVACIEVPATELEVRWGWHLDSFQDSDFPVIRWSLRGWAPTARTEFVCSTSEAGSHMSYLHVPAGTFPMGALLADLQLQAHEVTLHELPLRDRAELSRTRLDLLRGRVADGDAQSFLPLSRELLQFDAFEESRAYLALALRAGSTDALIDLSEYLRCVDEAHPLALQLLAEAAERGNRAASTTLDGIRRWHP